MPYNFIANDRKPGYVTVINPTGQSVAELWHDDALVISIMYQNKLSAGHKGADDFVYAYLLGMTHCMLHADRYPRCEINREGNVVNLRMHAPKNDIPAGDNAA